MSAKKKDVPLQWFLTGEGWPVVGDSDTALPAGPPVLPARAPASSRREDNECAQGTAVPDDKT